MCCIKVWASSKPCVSTPCFWQYKCVLLAPSICNNHSKGKSWKRTVYLAPKMLKILRQNAFFGMQPVECCDRVALLLTNPLCANYVQIKNPTILKLFLTTNRTKNLSKLQLPSTNHLCIPKITYILSFSYSSKVFCILGAFIFIYLIFGRRGTLHNVQNGGGDLTCPKFL